MKRRDSDYTVNRRHAIEATSMALAALALGCGAPSDEEPPGDPTDGGPPPDAGAADMTSKDAIPPDAMPSDAMPPDAIPPDAMPDASPPTGACRVTPRGGAGPYYIDTGEIRRDVTDGYVGAPLRIRLTMLDAETCEPLADLPVDLWSANAAGDYSGVDNGRGRPDVLGETFMRGRQIADADGVVVFEAIYPGWYSTAPPHLHFTAPFDDEQNFTWVFYLDDAFSAQVFSTIEPYRDRQGRPAQVADFGDRLDAEAVIVPDGPPEAPVIDLEITIDRSNLRPRP